jgi:Ca-activated chloride channel family protein
MSGKPFTRDIKVDFAGSEPQHDALATLWARTRVEDLMSQDYAGAQQDKMKPELQTTVTQLGLEYRLMTQFTSFVAVEEVVVTDGGQPRRIDVPVEVPEGVNRDGLVNREDAMLNYFSAQQITNLPMAKRTVSGLKSSSTNIVTRSGSSAGNGRARGAGGGGIGGGIGSGSGSGKAANVRAMPPNSPPMIAAIEVDSASPISPDDQKRAALAARLHPSVLALLDRLKKNEMNFGPEEAKFVRDGNVELQIWLTDKSDETLVKLKELGFQVVLDPKSAKLIIGRLPLAKLSALIELTEVRYVAPQLSAL